MVKNNIFKHSYDKALFTYYILRRLEAGKVDSFNERLMSQKVQYFAQLFKASPCYSFSLYIRGPYSPDLAYDLFQIKKEGLRMKLDKFIPIELEKRFGCLKKFIQGKSIRQLELTATLHWLLRVARLSEVRAKKWLVEWKKASPDEIEYAFNVIKEL
ncbi:hypothetical protein D4R86_04105 [bacterium]|nr:MAG: hypothetical protein D4R86_04105 [bacterium]